MVLVGGAALTALILSTLFLLIILLMNVKVKNKKQVNWYFIFMIICLMICDIGQMLSIIVPSMTDIEPIYFDYIVYVGTCFLPITFFFFTLSFLKTKIKFKKKYLLLFVIPIISLLVLWTNDLHHLFYVKYSVINLDTVFGAYFPVHSIYTYVLILASFVVLLRYTIKNSGFFSKQSLYVTLGMAFPLGVNIIGAFGVPMSIYITPICFTVTAFFFWLVATKYNFLNVSPIALQTVVDRISDGYIVLDVNNTIIDFNKTFLKTANTPANRLRGKNMFALIAKDKYFNIDANLLKEFIDKSKTTGKTYSFEIKLSNVEKYFNVEVCSIFSNTAYVGSLILFKDITQHTLDLRTINENQDMLMEKERLASLGQLVGGIAHNLKTPIMSISGATEGLRGLIKEYELSVGDPDVTVEDHKDIARDMYTWVNKIKEYSEYMSDVITAVKGQTVTLINEEDVSFTITELLKRVDILMKHELKNALVYLNVKVNTDENLSLNGDVNSLVQVINNMISNSIQAYKGKKEENIDLIVDRNNNNLLITVKDYGPGIPKTVMKKLFKEMVTTKGKNGTGLGLFMSYSTIRGHFNGNITVDSKKGEGTTFVISLPLYYN